ncbi:MAG: hypothetical protein WKF88_11910 [Ferruginibacter sp.]
MRKFLFFMFLLLSREVVQAQKQKADSLAALLSSEKTDTGRVTYMWKIASYLYSYDPDSALRIAQKALFYSQRIKYTEGESRSIGQMANGFLSMGNYPRALEYYIKKLKLEEKRNNPYNLASVTMNIGIVNVYREEYETALYYLYRADSIITKNEIKDLQFNIKLNLGDVYDRKDITDSAFFYFGGALQIAKQMKEGDFIGTAMTGLGHAYAKAGNKTGALQFYKDALPYLEAANDEDLLCEAQLGLGKLYFLLHKNDSAAYFARNAFLLANKDGFLSRQLDAANFLTELYYAVPDKDSAYFYLQQAYELGNSINSKTRIRESNILSVNEQLRQDEMAEDLRKSKAERAKQLQLLLIGLFIPAFFLLTLLLSRVRVPVRIIRFLGVISLLILFEYLTLLLHPMVAAFTHHTPIYELLIFVVIASLLIPAHHRVEHWLIKRLTLKHANVNIDNVVIKKQRLKMKKLPEQPEGLNREHGE